MRFDDAESVWDQIAAGASEVEVHGRDLVSNLPMTVTVRSERLIDTEGEGSGSPVLRRRGPEGSGGGQELALPGG